MGPLFLLLLCHYCFAAFDYSSCKDSQTCLGIPQGCISTSNCEFGVGFHKRADDPDYVRFQLFAARQAGAYPNQYVALGFSKDERMGDDAVTLCITPEQGQGSVSLSYNPGYYNELLNNVPTDVIKDQTHKVENNLIMCEFSQKITIANSDPKIFNLDTKLHPILAVGSAQISSQTGQLVAIDQHNTQMRSTFEPLTFSDAKVGAKSAKKGINPEVKRKLKKAHGIIMLIAWWFLAVCAILFARYFKSMWPASEPMGLRIWFHLHRGLNYFAVLCVVAAFVCIFTAESWKWEGPRFGQNSPASIGQIHSALGLAACLAMFIQPIMAFFRGGKDAKFRWVFNWVHRIVGIAAWVVSAICIWYTTGFKSMGLHRESNGHAPKGLIIFYWVCLGVSVIILEVMLTISERLKKDSRKTRDIPMDDMASSYKTDYPNDMGVVVKSPKYGLVRLITIAVFAIIAAIVVLVLCIMIGKA